MYEDVVKGKTVLITGGTGSLGNDILSEIVNHSPHKIIILSRDENKQYHMKNTHGKYPFIDFELGDIRDYNRLLEVTKGADIIIHAAALKHIPPGEREPMEFIKTNVLGAKNIVDAAIKNEVPVVVGVSTDKAVKPVNVYGMTKGLQERLMLSANERQSKTKFVCVRYGNVIGSRGSVIPFFKERIQKGETLPITVPSMTRFLLQLPEAVHLILHAIKHGEGGEVFVKKMPAANIVDLAKAMGESMTGNKDYPVAVIGIRPGEKIHELLVSEDEMHRAVETENHYVIHDYGKLKEPQLINNNIPEYSSANTVQLNRQEIITVLKKAG